MKRLTLLWCAFLVIAAVLASTFMRAQAVQELRILSGADIGFRVEGMDRAGKPTGTLMVRINGKWVEATSKMTVRPATE
jgi:hypothetical protein